jgi:hypothetical protein
LEKNGKASCSKHTQHIVIGHGIMAGNIAC